MNRHPTISKLIKHRSAVFGMGILFFFICVAVLVPFLATHPPDTGEVSKRLQAPSKEHWLGTDRVGKDVYSRLIYGSRISIKIGLIAVVGSVL
ncbi:peptide ABC transporter permease, partial [Candidatus Poribacteria bacterium]